MYFITEIEKWVTLIQVKMRYIQNKTKSEACIKYLHMYYVTTTSIVWNCKKIGKDKCK